MPGHQRICPAGGVGDRLTVDCCQQPSGIGWQCQPILCDQDRPGLGAIAPKQRLKSTHFETAFEKACHSETANGSVVGRFCQAAKPQCDYEDDPGKRPDPFDPFVMSSLTDRSQFRGWRYFVGNSRTARTSGVGSGRSPFLHFAANSLSGGAESMLTCE
ncbi:MAG: hypothetical protein JWM11_5366 [Planctomycetaceae bacterium]|nr:hypothetical protein [Planctomycetaceae bacterium]